MRSKYSLNHLSRAPTSVYILQPHQLSVRIELREEVILPALDLLLGSFGAARLA